MIGKLGILGSLIFPFLYCASFKVEFFKKSYEPRFNNDLLAHRICLVK